VLLESAVKAKRGRPKNAVVKTCSEIGCDKPVEGLGLCESHYKRLYYLRRKNSDLCIACGNPRDLAYRVYCESCADKNRRAHRIKYAEGRP
jgi:hypothetical protein